ncbi:hypothetical protein [Absidia glauca]|uniref:BSD domain-containing protein n=1 Tax=Absidia glauca TaxID=4829 RepID=A0A168QBG3_ABSGL|nr:hypothetical protein [Absidia glauca]
MDDFYAYTTSAINADSCHNEDQSPQDDALVAAFTNFGWGQRFNSLLDTVKKQVEVTKKDLQEFASTIRDDTNGLVGQLSQSVTSSRPDNESTTPMNNNGERSIVATDNTNLYASLREGLGKISTVDFTTLRNGLSDTLKNQALLPAQLTSIKLPENISLGELRQELDEGTRFAELYLQKFGTEVIQVLNNTITVLDPEQQDGDDLSSEQETSRAHSSGSRIFASRTEASIANLQTDRNTLLTDPRAILVGNDKEKHTKDVDLFDEGFDIQKRTSEISDLLENSPELRQTMNDLVPLQIDYTTFWKRYFYHVWRITQEEERRKLLVKGVDPGDEDDFKWDSDDDDTSDRLTTNTSEAVENENPRPLDTVGDSRVRNNSETNDNNSSRQPATTLPSSSNTHTEGAPTVQPTKHVSGYNIGDGDDDSDSDWE